MKDIGSDLEDYYFRERALCSVNISPEIQKALFEDPLGMESITLTNTLHPFTPESFRNPLPLFSSFFFLPPEPEPLSMDSGVKIAPSKQASTRVKHTNLSGSARTDPLYRPTSEEKALYIEWLPPHLLQQ